MKTALREHGGKHSLLYASGKGMLEVAGELIKEGADVNQQNRVSLAGCLLCSKRMRCIMYTCITGTAVMLPIVMAVIRVIRSEAIEGQGAGRGGVYLYIFLYYLIYIYRYIGFYIYREREREREIDTYRYRYR